MNLWIDCEWTQSGSLISMALVDDEDDFFYEVLNDFGEPGAWQAKRVIPILGKAPVDAGRFTALLYTFLNKYKSINVIADWPQDIAYFCTALVTAPGVRLNTPPLTMEVVRLDGRSALPHNALEDARGLREAWFVDREHA